MEEIRTKGIVIDTKDYKEYDKIVTILTYDMGVISARLKGVKKSTAKSRFAGQIFCFVDLILSKKGKYYTIISCDLIESFFEIAYNYEGFLLAVDIVKVIKYVSKYNPDSSELFVVFLSILNVLLKTKANNDIVYIKFLLMTLRVLGFEHKYNVCDKCGKLFVNGAILDQRTGAIVCVDCTKERNINITNEELNLIKVVLDCDYVNLEKLKIGENIDMSSLQFVQHLFKVHCNQ